MKYDVNWLSLIKGTRGTINLVEPMLIIVPDPHDHEILLRQFHVLRNDFESDVRDGRDPTKSAYAVTQLAELIFSLTRPVE